MWTNVSFSRRHMLARCMHGFGLVALGELLAADSKRKDPLATVATHFPAKAKNVIYIYMSGGVSQVDTFDYKPALEKIAGKRLPAMSGATGEIEAFLKQPHAALPSPFPFQPYGGSGKYISSLFPHLGSVADDLAFVHGVKVDSNNHAPSTMHVNTGSVLQGNPGVGAWVTYGLGSENRNLPGYIVLHDPRGGPVNGSAVWSSGFLPAAYQGTPFRPSGDPVLNLASPPHLTRDDVRQQLDVIRWLNEKHASQRVATGDLEARISAYELAYRMQAEAPEVINVSSESQQVREMYGVDHPITDSFGRQCLMARRLVEKGVRFVSLIHGWENGIYSWDHHSDLQSLLPARSREVDQPVTALLRDLKQRGLWDDTLVVWISEMGRTPFAETSQSKPGRNHNQYGLTCWLAGAGIRGGATVGATDEFGLKAAEEPIPVRDVHATLLHLLGIDNRLLTYLHEGRYKRLTDTGGSPLTEILA